MRRSEAQSNAPFLDSLHIFLEHEDKTVPIKEDEEICPTTENSIAIDVGLERFLTCDDGSYVRVPQFLRKSARKMSRLQRRKSKLPNGSKDKQKLHKLIAKLHQKIARQRLNFHFSTAYWLFSKADVVFVEDLKLKNLIRRNKPKLENGKFVSNNQSSSSGMNKSWLDAAHGQFVQILEWVAWKLGKSVVKIDPWGTSQFCHACLHRVPKALNDRWHLCVCGESLNRDHNSAKLQKLVGLELASLKTAPRGKTATKLMPAF